MENRKPTWGDTVLIANDAPFDGFRGKFAAVCGIRTIETSEQARRFAGSLGETLYLVEVSNGESTEIPERYLELVRDEEH